MRVTFVRCSSMLSGGFLGAGLGEVQRSLVHMLATSAAEEITRPCAFTVSAVVLCAACTSLRARCARATSVASVPPLPVFARQAPAVCFCFLPPVCLPPFFLPFPAPGLLPRQRTAGCPVIPHLLHTCRRRQASNVHRPRLKFLHTSCSCSSLCGLSASINCTLRFVPSCCCSGCCWVHDGATSARMDPPNMQAGSWSSRSQNSTFDVASRITDSHGRFGS